MVQQYRYAAMNCLFKTYIDFTYGRYFQDVVEVAISTQEDYIRSCIISNHEELLIDIIKGFNIPAGLPWYLVDDLYVPVNCDGEFH